MEKKFTEEGQEHRKKTVRTCLSSKTPHSLNLIIFYTTL